MFKVKTLAKCHTVYFKSLPGASFRRHLRKLPSGFQTVISLCLLMCVLFSGVLVFAMPTAPWVTIPVFLLTAASLWLCISTDSIDIAEKGIVFPHSQQLSLRGRPIRLWSDVDLVQVKSGTGSQDSRIRKNGSSLRMTFKSGGEINLPLACFTRESVATFVSALQEWADAASFDRHQLEHVPRLWDYEEGELAGLRELSYTKFWDEELANNYSFTSYVPLQIGQKVNGNLTVKRQLAAGGFSAIYLVVAEGTSGSFILKESVVPATADEKTREKAKEHFRREAEILIKLDHPLIAKVRDHFVSGGRDYLMLEYIEGPDARELLRQQGVQPLTQVLRWANQLAEILQYLHAQQPPVVHRDLSPDNIVIDSSANAVLIDFGAANEFVGEATGTLVGKQAYMSPEQIKGKVTPQSDIFSFGATLHFLLTGKDPEPLSSSHPNLVAPGIPDQLDDLVACCTKLDTSQRLASAEALQARLKSLSNNNQVSALAAEG